MDVKTVALDKEAYDLLRRQKAKGESFSEVVKRLYGKRRPLATFAGSWKSLTKKELRQIEEALQKGRELDRDRAANLLRRLG